MESFEAGFVAALDASAHLLLTDITRLLITSIHWSDSKIMYVRLPASIAFLALSRRLVQVPEKWCCQVRPLVSTLRRANEPTSCS